MDRKAFEGRRILIGVCGGIAAYKVASVVSALAQSGAEVTVAMTESATRFVTPLTFQALSGSGGVHESMGSVRGRGPAARSAGLGSRCGAGGAVHDEQCSPESREGLRMMR